MTLVARKRLFLSDSELNSTKNSQVDAIFLKWCLSWLGVCDIRRESKDARIWGRAIECLNIIRFIRFTFLIIQ